MDTAQPSFPATTGNPERLHGFLDRGHDRGNRHDDAVHHHVFDAIEIDGALAGKAGEPHGSIAKILGKYAGNEDVRHDGRLDQRDAHFADPFGRRGCSSSLPAQDQVDADQSGSARAVSGLFAFSESYGSEIVNSQFDARSGGAAQ